MKVLNLILNRFEEIIVSTALGLATILTFIEVVLRYVFSSSLGFTQEAVIYLLILTGLIGASIGVREKVHLGVDVVIKQFHPIAQKLLVLLTILVSLLFTVTFVYFGIKEVGVIKQFGQVTPELEWPLYIPIMMVPFSFALMTIRFLQEFIHQLKIPASETFKEEEGEFDEQII